MGQPNRNRSGRQRADARKSKDTAAAPHKNKRVAPGKVSARQNTTSGNNSTLDRPIYHPLTWRGNGKRDARQPVADRKRGDR